MNTAFDISSYKHSISGRVRSFDVDRQNIVHNAEYLYWLETARIEFFRDIGIPITLQTFIADHKFVVARTEIDYLQPAIFDEQYEVLTRIPEMRNTSFTFDQIIRSKDSGNIIAKAQSVIVHLNAQTNIPEHISDTYRDLVNGFQQGTTH